MKYMPAVNVCTPLAATVILMTFICNSEIFIIRKLAMATEVLYLVVGKELRKLLVESSHYPTETSLKLFHVN